MYLDHHFASIVAARYNVRTSELILLYVNSTVSYSGVPREVYQQMIEASNADEFFSEHIYGQYQSTNITATVPSYDRYLRESIL